MTNALEQRFRLGRGRPAQEPKMQSEEYQERIFEFYVPFLAEHGDDTATFGYPEAVGQ